MSFEVTGKLIDKGETQVVSDRFKKREFVLLREENVNGTVFTDYIKFQSTQDRCELVEPFSPESTLKVSFNIRGNKWEKNGQTNYFTNLDAWKIEAVGNTASASPEPPSDTPFPSEAPPETDDNDELPF